MNRPLQNSGFLKDCLFSSINYHTRWCNIFLIALLLFVLYISFFNQELRTANNGNYIFTFWEPRDKLSGYLKLCMETWKETLPNYSIILLDYSNLE